MEIWNTTTKDTEGKKDERKNGPLPMILINTEMKHNINTSLNVIDEKVHEDTSHLYQSAKHNILKIRHGEIQKPLVD